MQFSKKQKQYIDMVDAYMQAELQNARIPDLLKQSMSYSLFSGGKRLRPSIVLAATELFGGDIESALPYACAVEMIHNYSLIHDDLPAMDNDQYRRGRLTNHMVFGYGQAILAGDGLLSLAFEVLLSALMQNNAPQFIAAAHAISKGAGVTGMVRGQCLDLEQEGNAQKNTETLLAVHHNKTAAMMIACLESGAYCANATEENIDCLRAFGSAYGLLFQITDDILDVEGNMDSLGKTIGKDAACNKLTFVTVYGLDNAKEQAQIAHDTAMAALNKLNCDISFFKSLLSLTLTRKK